MSQLPIEAVLPDLLAAIQANSQVILKAATGAGKSTYFPLSLLQSGKISGKIVLLEPRRLAAKNIAQYIASQAGEPVGQRVGYRIRGESKVSQHTQLEIVTEGVLTRMIQTDPELAGVGLIIFDEFHERNIHADLALTLCLEVQDALRDDLKLVVMSATLDLAELNHLLPDARFIESQGRSFPVEYSYAPLKPNDSVVSAVVKQIKGAIIRESGSILVFLPGVRMIQQVMQQLKENLSDDTGFSDGRDFFGDTHFSENTRSSANTRSFANVRSSANIDICPLYGQLDFRQQQKAIQPPQPGRRKIVLATNVAETSLTIEGIRVVIDTGLERTARFDPAIGVTRLEQSRISRSSAEQRAGRAGRICEGTCIRLYSEAQFRQQSAEPVPEIMRTDLSSLALDMALWGVKDVHTLRWMTPPPEALLAQGRDLLQCLEVMDENYSLTSLGQEVYRLGVDVRLAAMLLRAKQKGNEYVNTAIAAAVLTEETGSRQVNLADGLYQWQNGRHVHGSRLNQQSRQLSARLDVNFALSDVHESLLGVVLGLAFPDRIAQRRGSHQNGQFLLANGHGAFLPEDEVIAGEDYLIVADLMKYASGNSQILKAVSLDITRLTEAFPELVLQQNYVDWHESKGRLIAESRWCLGKLIIRSEDLPAPDAKEMTQALLNYVRRKGLNVLDWNEASQMWLNRVRCAVEWLPEEDWPLMDDESLLDDLDNWLLPYMAQVNSLKALKQVPVLDALKSRLGWELSRSLDSWLPVYHRLPTGQQKRIRYQAGQEPTLSVRIQEVYGEKETPLIAKGTRRLLLELLSPAQRPVQITRDLAAFWAGSYAEVRKEMKGRYPKHVWPEDPANHIATTKTKRQLNQ